MPQFPRVCSCTASLPSSLATHITPRTRQVGQRIHTAFSASPSARSLWPRCGDEGFARTELGRDVDIQTLECLATGPFTNWKDCERVRCVIPPRIVSGAIDGCTVCQVYFGGKLPYSRSLGHTLDGSPQGSKTFTASCARTGRHMNRHHNTAVVCQKPKRRLRSAVLLSEQVPVAKYGELVPYKCLSVSSVARSQGGDPRWLASQLNLQLCNWLPLRVRQRRKDLCGRCGAGGDCVLRRDVHRQG